jgi:hypothetical protein
MKWAAAECYLVGHERNMGVSWAGTLPLPARPARGSTPEHVRAADSARWGQDRPGGTTGSWHFHEQVLRIVEIHDVG